MKTLFLLAFVSLTICVQAQAECAAEPSRFSDTPASERFRLVCDDADFGGFSTLREAKRAASFRNMKGSCESCGFKSEDLPAEEESK